MNRNRPKGDPDIWLPDIDLKITVIIMFRKIRINTKKISPENLNL